MLRSFLCGKMQLSHISQCFKKIDKNNGEIICHMFILVIGS